MRALILERNKKVSRRLARFFLCAGYEVEMVEEPAQVVSRLQEGGKIGLVAADSFDGDVIARLLLEHPHVRGLLWTAEPLKRSLRFVEDIPQISNICARKDFESTPRDWELIMIARQLRGADAPRIGFADFLHWGYSGFQEQVAGTAHRDALVARTVRFVERLGVPKRIGEMSAELAHELLMNAIYDAPATANGTRTYAGNRKADVVLQTEEQPMFRLASDGSRLIMQVSDRFGRLERAHVFGGLARAFAGGVMDTTHGGAGLGMLVCHNATVAMFYHVVAGKQTEVTGIFDLDLNLRELRTQAKSLHYFAE
jgi:hypothetical protein